MRFNAENHHCNAKFIISIHNSPCLMHPAGILLPAQVELLVGEQAKSGVRDFVSKNDELLLKHLMVLH